MVWFVPTPAKGFRNGSYEPGPTFPPFRRQGGAKQFGDGFGLIDRTKHAMFGRSPPVDIHTIIKLLPFDLIRFMANSKRKEPGKCHETRCFCQEKIPEPMMRAQISLNNVAPPPLRTSRPDMHACTTHRAPWKEFYNQPPPPSSLQHTTWRRRTTPLRRHFISTPSQAEDTSRFGVKSHPQVHSSPSIEI